MPEHQTNEFGQPIGPAVSADLPVPAPRSERLSGRTCELVPLDPSRHAVELFESYAAAPDQRGWTYLSGGPFDTSEELSDWLATILRLPDAVFFTIVDARGPCGIAAYLRINPSAASIEVGSLHFAARLAGTVSSTEAMYLMMRHAFDLGYRRYEWKCDSLNAPSRAAAERLGFTYEGDFRNAVVYKHRSRDTSWFSIIDDEWPARRAEFRRWLEPDNFDESGRQRTPLRHSA